MLFGSLATPSWRNCDATKTNLTFRSDLTSGPAGYDNSTTDGRILRLGDWDGCSQLGGNPGYPASDPSTTSLTVTLTPAGALVDGTIGTAYTATVAADTLCIFNDDAVVDIPAGAWDITAVTNAGRQIAFADTQDGPATTQAVIFNAPQTESSPLAQLWISFADPGGAADDRVRAPNAAEHVEMERDAPRPGIQGVACTRTFNGSFRMDARRHDRAAVTVDVRRV